MYCGRSVLVEAPPGDLRGLDEHSYYALAGATPVLVHNCNENIISNADGFDNSAELSQAATGDVYSGAYNPNDGVFYARLSIDDKDPARFPNAVPQGGHGEVNFWHFSGSRETIGFNIFFEEDGISVAWLSRSVNRRRNGDPMAPLEERQAIMDAVAGATGRRVRSRCTAAQNSASRFSTWPSLPT